MGGGIIGSFNVVSALPNDLAFKRNDAADRSTTAGTQRFLRKFDRASDKIVVIAQECHVVVCEQLAIPPYLRKRLAS